MPNQEKIHKLSKYALRLKKSFIRNNSSDYLKYCSHLKHHIGGDGNTDLNTMFDGLIKLINNKPEYKFENLTNTNAELTEQIKNYETYNDELISKLQEVSANNDDLNLKKEVLKEELMAVNDNLKEEKEKAVKEKEEDVELFKGKLEEIFKSIYGEKMAKIIMTEISGNNT